MSELESYQQLVQTGAIHQWQETIDAQEVASGFRFNLNQKTAIDHTIKAFSMAYELIQSLGKQSATKEELSQLNSSLNKAIESYASIEWVSDQNKTLIDSINSVKKNVDQLNDTFAMDSELADKVMQITQAMNSAIEAGGDSVKEFLTQLINVRYTKDETNELLLQKADKSNTFTKTEINGLFNNLNTVASSGDYSDLKNTPEIPTVPSTLSSFENDSKYQTESQVSNAISLAVGNISSALDAINGEVI